MPSSDADAVAPLVVAVALSWLVGTVTVPAASSAPLAATPLHSVSWAWTLATVELKAADVVDGAFCSYQMSTSPAPPPTLAALVQPAGPEMVAEEKEETAATSRSPAVLALGSVAVTVLVLLVASVPACTLAIEAAQLELEL